MTGSSTRKTMEVLIRDDETRLDILDQMLTYRETALAANGNLSLQKIAAQMANLGTISEIRRKRLSRKETLADCAHAIPRPHRCLPSDRPHNN